ncbi:MAG: type I 3-dehydroquinate dehydratase [Candidatus Xiphinematobacter sp.]|nr:MAG: type I 3-dehydroquinate dehydratase [Candidatus Xiphinematobacter sp.]QQY11236.1 MAG: type I 3-dehydroquinate dehydratase [Candidatus Xiphinematobacter sp.]
MSLLLCLNRPNVIGILHCKKVEKLECLSEDQLFGVDAIELRLDLLDGFPLCLRGIANARRPLIVTARHPREGGNRDLTMERRLELLAASMSFAVFVDLELQFWEELSPILQIAKKSGVRVIASFHHFSETPSITELLKKVSLAKRLGADLFKVATYLNDSRDLACLLELLDYAASLLPVAAMGMGPLGMVSRLVLARCGSTFNYGWLVRPMSSMIPGQWPAKKLAERLKEIA